MQPTATTTYQRSLRTRLVFILAMIYASALVFAQGAPLAIELLPLVLIKWCQVVVNLTPFSLLRNL